MPLAIVQEWTESERGWGYRPDGYTLHLTEEDRVLYVATYYARYNKQDVVPNEYSFASHKFTADISDAEVAKLTTRQQEGGDPLTACGMWGDRGTSFPDKPATGNVDVSWTRSGRSGVSGTGEEHEAP